MNREKHIIDAKNQPLGRLATRIAVLLRGKHKPDFIPYLDKGDFVIVKNGKEIRLTGRKWKQKVYYRHSGYLGGLKTIPFEQAFKKNYKEVIRRAVYGMMPKNKLRAKQIKRLRIE